MIKNILSVIVLFHGRKVGTLSMGNQSCCQFEYDRAWLRDGFSISPLQLPMKAGLFSAQWQPFKGNFGIFEDSLPGGYGEFLLSKVLRREGIDYYGLTPVQRLSLVGNSGMGALCYVPETIVGGNPSSLSLLRCCPKKKTQDRSCCWQAAEIPAECVQNAFTPTRPDTGLSSSVTPLTQLILGSRNIITMNWHSRRALLCQNSD